MHGTVRTGRKRFRQDRRNVQRRNPDPPTTRLHENKLLRKKITFKLKGSCTIGGCDILSETGRMGPKTTESGQTRPALRQRLRKNFRLSMACNNLWKGPRYQIEQSCPVEKFVNNVKVLACNDVEFSVQARTFDVQTFGTSLTSFSQRGQEHYKELTITCILQVKVKANTEGSQDPVPRGPEPVGYLQKQHSEGKVMQPCAHQTPFERLTTCQMRSVHGGQMPFRLLGSLSLGRDRLVGAHIQFLRPPK